MKTGLSWTRKELTKRQALIYTNEKTVHNKEQLQGLE